MRQQKIRIKIPPESMIQRLETLLESIEIVESSIIDFQQDVQLPDAVVSQTHFSVNLGRRQMACLRRAIKAIEEQQYQ